MRTFVNVHTGVASGTSLIYMYDASKQNAKKKSLSGTYSIK